MMLRIFTGWDQREAEGWHVFAQSVVEKCGQPVAIVPLNMNAQRDGTNAFTYSRFLVPHLCNFQGYAIFADGVDMVCQSDLAELWEQRSGWHAVQVVKHDYKTKHDRKYRGTVMEAANQDYERKNWSSLILWNCAHYMNRVLTPEFVSWQAGRFLHRFEWLPDERIGELSPDWNWLADEFGASTTAKIVHYTAGIPGIPAHAKVPHGQAWFYYRSRSHEIPEERRIAEVASAR